MQRERQREMVRVIANRVIQKWGKVMGDGWGRERADRQSETERERVRGRQRERESVREKGKERDR